jgi:hypothetical protein
MVGIPPSFHLGPYHHRVAVFETSIVITKRLRYFLSVYTTPAIKDASSTSVARRQNAASRCAFPALSPHATSVEQIQTGRSLPTSWSGRLKYRGYFLAITFGTVSCTCALRCCSPKRHGTSTSSAVPWVSRFAKQNGVATVASSPRRCRPTCSSYGFERQRPSFAHRVALWSPERVYPTRCLLHADCWTTFVRTVGCHATVESATQ